MERNPASHHICECHQVDGDGSGCECVHEPAPPASRLSIPAPEEAARILLSSRSLCRRPRSSSGPCQSGEQPCRSTRSQRTSITMALLIWLLSTHHRLHHATTSSVGVGSIAILLGNGDGTFSKHSTLCFVDRPDETPHRLAVTGDLNRDGNVDLLITVFYLSRPKKLMPTMDTGMVLSLLRSYRMALLRGAGTSSRDRAGRFLQRWPIEYRSVEI